MSHQRSWRFMGSMKGVPPFQRPRESVEEACASWVVARLRCSGWIMWRGVWGGVGVVWSCVGVGLGVGVGRCGQALGPGLAGMVACLGLVAGLERVLLRVLLGMTGKAQSMMAMRFIIPASATRREAASATLPMAGRLW